MNWGGGGRLEEEEEEEEEEEQNGRRTIWMSLISCISTETDLPKFINRNYIHRNFDNYLSIR